MSIQIFISYKHHEIDSKIAQELFEKLQDWGYNPWMDVHSIPKGIGKMGTGWVGSVNQGLQKAHMVIGLISTESLESDNVIGEWMWAIEEKVPILFVVLRNFDSKLLAPPFRKAIRINYSNGHNYLRVELSKFIDEQVITFNDEPELTQKQRESITFQVLISKLNDKDFDVRRNVIQALGTLWGHYALKYIIPMLNDEVWIVRLAVVETISAFLSIDDCRQYLIPKLFDENHEVRARVSFLLASTADKSIINLLISMLNDDYSDVRIQTLLGLREVISDTELHDMRLRKTLIDMLKGNNEIIDELVADLLGSWGDKNAIEPLTFLLEKQYHNQNISVRCTAAIALGKLGYKNSIEPLIEFLRDRNNAWEIVPILGQFKDNRAVEPLLEILQDEWNSYNYLADDVAKALISIGSASVQPVIEALKKQPNHNNDWEHNVLDVYLQILRQIGYEVIQPIINLYEESKDSNDNVKNMVYAILIGIRDNNAVPDLIGLLEYDDKSIRCMVAYSLGNIGNPTAVSPLVSRYKVEQEENVKHNIIFALRQIGTQEAKQALISLGFSPEK